MQVQRKIFRRALNNCAIYNKSNNSNNSSSYWTPTMCARHIAWILLRALSLLFKINSLIALPLRSHWLTTYKFQAYNIVIWYLYTLLCARHHPLSRIWPFSLFCPPTFPLPSGSHHSVVCEFVCFCFVLFVPFLFYIPHPSEIIWFRPFLCDWLHLAPRPPSSVSQAAILYLSMAQQKPVVCATSAGS